MRHLRVFAMTAWWRASVLAGVVAFACMVPAAAAADLPQIPGPGHLTITVHGDGVVLVDPSPFSRPAIPVPTLVCPPSCETSSDVYGRDPVMTAVPGTGSVFAGWDFPVGGAARISPGVNCDGASVCTVPLVQFFDVPISGPFGIEIGQIRVPVDFDPVASFVKIPRDPDGVFLCYSKFQNDPGVWLAPDAVLLSGNGYWRPYAVRGDKSATRLGPFSLVCSLPEGLTVSDRSFVDDSGAVVTDVRDPQLGLYPLAG